MKAFLYQPVMVGVNIIKKGFHVQNKKAAQGSNANKGVSVVKEKQRGKVFAEKQNRNGNGDINYAARQFYKQKNVVNPTTEES